MGVEGVLCTVPGPDSLGPRPPVASTQVVGSWLHMALQGAREQDARATIQREVL